MKVTRLEVHDLRNLSRVSIRPGEELNVFFGSNGSGKTSLIEAVHVLALGRSFRTQQTKPLVRYDQKALTVFGLVENAHQLRIGVKKNIKGDTSIKINGQRASSAAELAAAVPIQLINPESHSLLEGGPRERRAYIDWALFHVEQSFISVWRRYMRTVDQRNAALRAGTQTVPWDRTLVELGQALSEYRHQYVERLKPVMGRFVQALLEGYQISLDYYPGWPRDLSLEASLAECLEKDRRLGFTSVGPHRADLRVKVGGRPAAEVLSRGQEKLLVAALRLGQLAWLRESSGKESLLLVDDLPSELDWEKRTRLLELMRETGAQSFVTATDRDQIPVEGWGSVRWFHVEHGRVAEVV